MYPWLHEKLAVSPVDPVVVDAEPFVGGTSVSVHGMAAQAWSASPVHTPEEPQVREEVPENEYPALHDAVLTSVRYPSAPGDQTTWNPEGRVGHWIKYSQSKVNPSPMTKLSEVNSTYASLDVEE